MTFSDIFKSNFLENVTSVTVLDMVLAIVLSFCVGLFIFFVYKKTYSGVMYSARLRRLSHRHDHDHHAGHYGRHEQRGPVARHGRRAVHRPLPHGDQGAHGHRLPVLVHRGGHRAGRGHDPAGGHRQRSHQG